MVHRGSQRLRVACNVHKPRLKRGHEREADADHEERRAGQDRVGCGEKEKREEHDVPDDDAENRRDQRPVREPPAGDVADNHAQAPQRKEQGHRALGHAGFLNKGWSDVAVDSEHAAEADRRNRERQPDLQAAEGGQLRAVDLRPRPLRSREQECAT